MTDSPSDAPLLELETMIGFEGGVSSGLAVHPNRQHLIYPVGCTVVIEDIASGKQEFLAGHTNSVSCLAISKSGKYIASGQVTHMGFKADIILWNFESRKMIVKFSLHKVKVEGLAFSPNDKYLVSLGGEDDGSVVVWCLNKKEAICGSPAQVMSAGITHTIAFANQSDEVFITGGNGTLRVWELDRPNRKIRPSDVNMGQLKRIIKCIQVAENDDYFYCGTTTGDVMAVNMSSHNFQVLGPEKERFGLGVTALALLKTGELIVGAGDGAVCVVKGLDKKFKKTAKVQNVKGAATSIALRGQGHQFFAGTDQGNVYRFNFAEYNHELIKTCHYAPVNDIAFAADCPDLIGTCSFQDIRIWSKNKNQELLRITVPNMTCNCLEIMKDGKSIVSGWDDGRIRAFYPESGKPMYTVEHAHKQPVTAMTTSSDCKKIVSGGKDGGIRMWLVERKHTPKGVTYVATLIANLKEHKAGVTCIKLRANDSECVSSSDDGSCIIWDLQHQCRRQMIRVNTLFKYVLYHPAEHQILTCGTDHKIGYWETYDGSMIRDLDGSVSGSLNAMGISADGMYFVSAGDDKLVKVWTYDEGETMFMGIGHSAPITRVEISPDETFIVSVSTDGAILRWKFPAQLLKPEVTQQVQDFQITDRSASHNSERIDKLAVTDRSNGYHDDNNAGQQDDLVPATDRLSLSGRSADGRVISPASRASQKGDPHPAAM